MIFDKLLSLVNEKSIGELTLNSRATYRYLEMLENILDLEESDQVLYKLQVRVLSPFFSFFDIHAAFLDVDITNSNCYNLKICDV